MSRSRSRSLGLIAASYGKWLPTGAVIYEGYSGPTGSEACQDTTMAPPFNVDHNFQVIKKSITQVARLSGKPRGNPNVEYFGLNPYVGSDPSYLPNPENTNWAYWETKALAGLNPSKPVISVPLFLFEFKDFPEMLRSAGHTLMGKSGLKGFPDGYLNAHFGWAPFASDVQTLFNIAKSIDDRMRYLRKLEDGGHFRRTLFSGQVNTSYDDYGYGFTFDGWAYLSHRQTIRNDKVWFTANAKSVTPLPRGTDVRSLSARQVLGLNLNPASVWDFLPWTWLIDYLGNIGDFMQANVGLCQIAVSRMNIMHLQDYRVIGNDKSELGLTVTPFVGFTTCKRRQVYANPIPWLASRPFLGGAQKLALGSLLTSRALGSVPRGVRN